MGLASRIAALEKAAPCAVPWPGGVHIIGALVIDDDPDPPDVVPCQCGGLHVLREELVVVDTAGGAGQ